MPRWRSSSIQSEVVARWFLRAVTEPANCTAPPYKRNFSVKVVLPASGCEMIAKVRRREISFSISNFIKCLHERRFLSGNDTGLVKPSRRQARLESALKSRSEMGSKAEAGGKS